MMRIGIIKPYVISQAELIRFLEKIKNIYPNSEVTILASISSLEKESFLQISEPSQKILFLRDKKFAFLITLLRFFLQFRFQKFSKVYVLIGPTIPKGYRKARLLASILSAERIFLHYLSNAKEESQPSIWRFGLKFLFARIGLYILACIFVLFALYRKTRISYLSKQ